MWAWRPHSEAVVALNILWELLGPPHSDDDESTLFL